MFGSSHQPNLFNPPATNSWGTPAPSNTGFGSSSTFGQNPPSSSPFGNPTTAGWGASNSTFGNPQRPPQATGFGGGTFGSAPTQGFGATPAPSAGGFGAVESSAWGQQASLSTNPPPGLQKPTQPTSQHINAGTGNPSYKVTTEKELGGSIGSATNYQSIGSMPEYSNWSVTELRVMDYYLQQKGPTGSTFGGSGWGAPAANTGWNATPTNPATGIAPNTSTFGTPHASPFGNPTNTFGNQPTNTFGSNTTSSFGRPAATNTFGSSTNTLGSTFGQNQPTNTFGQNNLTTGFGAPTPSPWGNQGAAPAISTSNEAKPFGVGTSNNPAPGGLFGSSAPTNAFGMPAATTTNTFGSSATTSTPSAFGAVRPPANNAFSFGTSTNTAPTTGFGGTSNSLFGGGGATGFGARPTNTAPTGGGLFGSNTTTTANATPSLFGNTAQNPPATQPAAPLFGASTANNNTFKPAMSFNIGNTFGNQNTPQFNASTGIGNMLGQPQLGQSIGPQQVLRASLDKNPYGINPILQRTPQKETTIAAPERETKERNTPRTGTKVKLRGVAVSQRGPKLQVQPSDVVSLGLDNRFTPRRSIKKLWIEDELSKPLEKAEKVFGGEEAVLNIVEEAKSSGSIKKLTPKKDGDEKAFKYYMEPSIDELHTMSDSELRSVKDFTITVPVFGSIRWLEPVDLISVANRGNFGDILGTIVTIESLLVTVYPDDTEKPAVGEGLNKPAEITLVGCFARNKRTHEIIDDDNDPRFKKHLKKLKSMDGTTFIGFEVVTGSWKFRVEHFSRYGLVDSDDESEDFDEGEDDLGPPRESEQDVSDHEDSEVEVEIDDTFEMVKKGYGFDEDSESNSTAESIEDGNEIDATNSDAVYEEVPHSSSTPVELSENIDTLDEDEQDFTVKKETEMDVEVQDITLEKESEIDVEVQDFTVERESEMIPKILEKSIPTIARMETARSVQTIKATLFGKASTNVPKRAVSSIDNEFRPEFSKQAMQDSPPLKYLKAQPTSKRFSFATRKKYRIKQDHGLFFSGSRVGSNFIDGGRIYFPSNTIGNLVIKEIDSVNFRSKRIQNEKFIQSLLGSAVFEVDEFQVPMATLSNVDFNEMKKLNLDSSKETNLWSLLAALYDAVGIFEIDKLSTEQIKVVESTHIQERISRWLSEIIQNQLNLRKMDAKGIDLIFLSLIERDIANAVKIAIEEKDYRLANVISQLGGKGSAISILHQFERLDVNSIPGRGQMPLPTAAAILSQIDHWKTSEKFKTVINSSHLAVWSLIAGNLEHWNEEIFQSGFDWHVCFAIFYWYAGAGRLSLSEAISLYEKNFAEQMIAKPVAFSGHQDVEFLLLRLKSGDTTLHLEEICNTNTYGNDKLDLRLCWALSLFLSSKEICKFKNPANYDKVCLEYVAELERMSLWKEGCFVASFLNDVTSRCETIKGLISRWYSGTDCSGSFCRLEENESVSFGVDSVDFTYLTKQLQIPAKWIHETRALNARSSGNHIQETISLIDAGEFNLAHSLIINDLAPIRILQNDYGLLQRLLRAIDGSRVKDWKLGGDLILQYIEIILSKNSGKGSRIEELLLKFGADEIIHHNSLKIKQMYSYMSTKILSIAEVENLLNVVSMESLDNIGISVKCRSEFIRDSAHLILGCLKVLYTPELLVEILQYLTRKEYHNLSAVSKGINAIVAPFLYANICCHNQTAVNLFLNQSPWNWRMVLDSWKNKKTDKCDNSCYNIKIIAKRKPKRFVLPHLYAGQPLSTARITSVCYKETNRALEPKNYPPCIQFSSEVKWCLQKARVYHNFGPFLKSFILTNVIIDENALAKSLHQMPNIVVLVFKNCDVGEVAMKAFPTQLHMLVIHNSKAATDVGALHLTKLIGLEHLDLTGCIRIGDRSLQAIIGSLVFLKTLIIDRYGCGNGYAVTKNLLLYLKIYGRALKYVGIGGCSISIDNLREFTDTNRITTWHLTLKQLGVQRLSQIQHLLEEWMQCEIENHRTSIGRLTFHFQNRKVVHIVNICPSLT